MGLMPITPGAKHFQMCPILLLGLLAALQTAAAAATARKNRECFGSDGNDLKLAVHTLTFEEADADKLQSVKQQYGESMGEWCVDLVSDFSYLFENSIQLKLDLSAWNTSSATTMEGMFKNVQELSVGDIGQWDVSNCRSMAKMFEDTSFDNQEELLGHWNVSSVEDFGAMFRRSSLFNQDLSLWNTASAVSMSNMFEGASSFDQDLSTWDVSSVERMQEMFRGATLFSGSGLDHWNISSTTSVYGMFRDASLFSANLSQWKVSGVQNFYAMFSGASSFESDLSLWDVSRGTQFHFMFEGAMSFQSDLSQWNVSNAETLESMFHSAIRFDSDLGRWNVHQVTEMQHLFEGAVQFSGQGLEYWDVSKVRWMTGAFKDAILFDTDLSRWNTSQVQGFDFMFANTAHFNSDISSWPVGRAARYNSMFQGATAFDQNMCSWGPKINSFGHQLVSVENMFRGSDCPVDSSPLTDAAGQLVGPFCVPCGHVAVPSNNNASPFTSAQEKPRLEAEEEEASEEMISAISRPVESSELNEEEREDESEEIVSSSSPPAKPSVHTHESAAKGVQIVLVMLVIFSLNGLLLSTLAKSRAQRRLEAASSNSSRGPGSYSPLSLSNHDEEAETEMAPVPPAQFSFDEETSTQMM